MLDFITVKKMEKSKDGRVDDPISMRSEFVVYFNKLVSRISGAELLFDFNGIKGTWLMKSWPRTKPKVLDSEEIIGMMKDA